MKKTRILAAVFAVLIAALMFFAGKVPAHADGGDEPMLIAENPAESADHTTGTKAIAAAAVVGIAAAAGALADFAERELGLKCRARCFLENTPSYHMITESGFRVIRQDDSFYYFSRA